MTVTSNLHNCAAWVTLTTYTAGQRVANDTGPVKAYQCITGGVSGATGPTGTGSSITDGTCVWKYLSAVDYTSLAAWYAALPSTLTQPVTALLWNDAVWGPSGALTGVTNVVGNMLTISAAAGESFVDSPHALRYNSANGVSVESSSNGVVLFDVGATYFTISRIQARQFASYPGAIFFADGGSQITVSQCIASMMRQTTETLHAEFAQALVYNTLFVSEIASGSNQNVIFTQSGTGHVVQNCTFCCPSNVGPVSAKPILNNYNSISVVNCVFVGYTTQTSGNGTFNLSFNATDQATFSSATSSSSITSLAYTTATFVNPSSSGGATGPSGSLDMRLVSGSALLDDGTSSVVEAFDIFNTARPQSGGYDIGCFELPGSSSISLFARGTAMGSGRIAGNFSTTIAAHGTAQAKGRVAPSFQFQSSARGSAQGHGRSAATFTAKVAAAGHAAGQGRLSGIFTAKLAASGSGRGAGRLSTLSQILLFATGTAMSFGRLAGSFKANVAARGTGAAQGKATGAYTAPLKATGSARGYGAATGTFKTFLHAAGTSISKGRAAATFTALLSAAGFAAGKGRLAGSFTAKLAALGKGMGTGSKRTVLFLFLTASGSARAFGRAVALVRLLQPTIWVTGRVRYFTAVRAATSSALGQRRTRTIVGIANNVAQTTDLLPPIDATVETETVQFDYGAILSSGVTLTGTPTITCVLSPSQSYQGSDPSPTSRLIGMPVIGTSKTTGGANQAVNQQIGTMIGGCRYKIQCVATTSDDQILSLWTHIGCETPV